MSPVHINAGKFASYIQIVMGTKLWLLLDPEGPDAPDDLGEMVHTNHKWVGVLLRPNDILYVYYLILKPIIDHGFVELCDQIDRTSHSH
jgi:hypothetical protein